MRLNELVSLGELVAALPHLRRLAEDPELPESARDRWYYRFREVALRATDRGALVDFLETELARASLSKRLRVARLADLRNLRNLRNLCELTSSRDTLALLQAQLDRPELGVESARAWFGRYREAALQEGRVADLVAYLEKVLSRPELADELRFDYVRELLAAGAAGAAIPYLETLARREDLTREARARWFDTYRETMSRAGRLDRLVAFIKGILESGAASEAEGAGWIEQLVSIGATDAALPYMRDLASRNQVSEGTRNPWYWRFRDAALRLGRRGLLLEFLREELARTEIAPGVRRDYLQALVDIDADALPHLRALAQRRDFGPAQRNQWYYRFQETALARGARDAVVDFLLADLEVASLSEDERALRLYDLRHIGGEAVHLAYLERMAGRRDLPSEAASTWFYAFKATAVGSGREDAFVRFLDRELHREDLSLPAREERLYALLEHGSTELALPHMRALAEGGIGDWSDAYVTALDELGRRPSLVEFLDARAHQEDLSFGVRRAAADRLLELDRKNRAESAYLSLAAEAPAGSPLVDQLLYLWGPRPAAEKIDWLRRRATGAAGPERAAWARLLITVGALDSAVAMLRPLAETPRATPAVVALLLQVLSLRGDRDEIHALLARRLASQPDRRTLREVAEAAHEQGFPDLEHAAYTRIIERDPDNEAALRRLGVLAFDAGRPDEARIHLGRYLTRSAGDYETHFLLAESLAAFGYRARAAPHYRHAVILVEADATPTFRMRTVRAQSLHRLEMTVAAAVAYTALLGERPGQAHLRADFVDMLIGTHDLRRANAVLAAR